MTVPLATVLLDWGTTTTENPAELSALAATACVFADDAGNAHRRRRLCHGQGDCGVVRADAPAAGRLAGAPVSGAVVDVGTRVTVPRVNPAPLQRLRRLRKALPGDIGNLRDLLPGHDDVHGRAAGDLGAGRRVLAHDRAIGRIPATDEPEC